MKVKKFTNGGQSVAGLLVFVMVAITVTTAAVSMTINSSLATSAVEGGEYVRKISDTGIEVAMLKIIRLGDSYSGETLVVEDGQVTISVSGTTSKTIRSEGTSGNYKRTVESVVVYNNNVLTPVSWKEVN